MYTHVYFLLKVFPKAKVQHYTNSKTINPFIWAAVSRSVRDQTGASSCKNPLFPNHVSQQEPRCLWTSFSHLHVRTIPKSPNKSTAIKKEQTQEGQIAEKKGECLRWAIPRCAWGGFRGKGLGQILSAQSNHSHLGFHRARGLSDSDQYGMLMAPLYTWFGSGSPNRIC